MLDEFDIAMEQSSQQPDEFDLAFEQPKQTVPTVNAIKPVNTTTKDEFDLEVEKNPSILGRTWELMKQSPPAKIFNTITQTGGNIISRVTPEPVKEALGFVMMPTLGLRKIGTPELAKKLGTLSYDLLASIAGDPTSYIGLGAVKKLGISLKNVKEAQVVAKELLASKTASQVATNVVKPAVTEAEVVQQIIKNKPNKLTLMNLQKKGLQRVTEQADNATKGVVKDYVYQPVVDAIENQLKEAVVNKQKIKVVAKTLIKDLKSVKGGSTNISKKLREFGEGVYTPTNPQEANALTKANNEFRSVYDDLFKKQNEALAPTGRQIKYRKDYHRHAQEMKALEDEFGSLDKVPDEIFNEWNKPEAYLRGQEKTRLNDVASDEMLGAFEAIDSYIDTASKTIHYTPEMTKLRSLANAVNTASGAKNNPFAHVFNKAADSLAGIRTETEKHIAVKGWDYLTNRMIKNAITFKLSSSLNQLASFPQMAALSGKPVKSLIEIGKQAARTVGNIPKNVYEFVAKPINKAHSAEVLKMVNNPTFKGAADFLPSQQLNIMLLGDMNKEKILFEGAGASKSKVGEALNEIGGAMMQTTNNLMLRAAYNTGVSQYLKKVGKTLKEAIENPEIGNAARKAGDFLVSHSQGEYIKHLKPLMLQHLVGKNIMPLGTYVMNNLNSITHDLPMLVREAAKAGKNTTWAASKYVGTLIGTTIATNYAYKKAGVRPPISATDYAPGLPAARFQSSSPLGMLSAPKDIYVEATEGQKAKTAVLLEKFVKDAAFKYVMPGGGSQLESLLMRGEVISPYRKKNQKPKKTKVKKALEKASKKVVDVGIKANDFMSGSKLFK